MTAIQAAPALRAVRNILLDIAIQPDNFYELPVSAFGEVGIGRRTTARRALSASLLLQSNNSLEPAQGLYQWDFTIAIEMFYRVDQDTETAELMLADAYPAAMDAFYHNRRLRDPETLLETVDSSRVSGPAANPWYEGLAGTEYRMQVLFLNCWKRATFPPVQPVS